MCQINQHTCNIILQHVQTNCNEIQMLKKPYFGEIIVQIDYGFICFKAYFVRFQTSSGTLSGNGAALSALRSQAVRAAKFHRNIYLNVYPSKKTAGAVSHVPKGRVHGLSRRCLILFCRTSQLLHELLDGLVQFDNSLLVVKPDRLSNALGDMVLKQNLTGIVDGGPDSCQLNQHLGTVPVVVDHPNDGIQMPARLGETVVDRFFVGMNMRDCGIVTVDCAVGMNMGMSPVLF